MHLIDNSKAIGSKVSVDLDCLLDPVPKALLDLLTNNPQGEVVDYRMTDGDGIGFVLQLSDGSTKWFFAEELEKTLNEQSLDEQDENNSSLKNNTFNQFMPKRNIPNSPKVKDGILPLFNPLNFIKWLIYSLSDVI